jgi:hypothetical protein
LNPNWVPEEEEKENHTPIPSFEVVVADIDLIQPQAAANIDEIEPEPLEEFVFHENKRWYY